MTITPATSIPTTITPAPRDHGEAPFSLTLTDTEAQFLRSIPRHTEVIRAALAQPIPVQEYLASVDHGLVVARASSKVLLSRTARQRESSPETLAYARERTLDRCLKRLPREVNVFGYLDDLETLTNKYVQPVGAARANAGGSRVLSIHIPASTLDPIRRDAARLGVPMGVVIRGLISARVEGARAAGMPLIGDPFSMPLRSRLERLEAAKTGLLAMAAEEGAEEVPAAA